MTDEAPSMGRLGLREVLPPFERLATYLILVSSSRGHARATNNDRKTSTRRVARTASGKD
jgi:hypothetical protein